MNIELELSHTYICFMTTTILEQDIKMIKKINNLMSKYISTKKSIYIQEIINMLVVMDNCTNLHKSKKFIIKYIDNEYKEKIEELIEAINTNDICKLNEMRDINVSVN